MKLINKLGVRLSMAVEANRVLGYPEKILFEPTNACNLSCPLCPTGNGTLNRVAGQMRLADFKRIIDEVRGKTRFIRFSGYGEPLIARDIHSMIRYAHDAGMETHLHSNILVLNSEGKMDNLLSSGLDGITISIDGASQETYEKYRIGGDVEKAFSILGELIKKRNSANLQRLRVRCQMVVTRQNEHEVDAVKARALALGVETFFAKTVNLALIKETGSNEVDKKAVVTFHPKNDKYSRYKDRSPTMENGCVWLYKEAVIFWNGNVTTCCHDPRGANVMGNIFEAGSLMNVWNGDKYQGLRKVVNSNIYAADPLCSNCPDRVYISDSCTS